MVNGGQERILPVERFACFPLRERLFPARPRADELPGELFSGVRVAAVAVDDGKVDEAFLQRPGTFRGIGLAAFLVPG
jgi:hypothetical protein